MYIYIYMVCMYIYTYMQKCMYVCMYMHISAHSCVPFISFVYAYA